MAERPGTGTLGQKLVRVLRQLRNAPTPAARTDLLKEVARITVDLREFFPTDSGEPDWSAKTWSYREYIRERYAEAGYTPDEARTTQTAVRYHVSTFVREKLSADELTDLGLNPESFTDRSRDKRAARAALLQAAQAPAEGANATAYARNIAGALLVLKSIDTRVLSDLTARERTRTRAVLEEIHERADALLAVMSAERRRER